MTKNSFGIVDYCFFAATLLVSAGIGMYFALKGRRKKAKDMFTGGGHMAILPTALSLMTSFMSGVTILAIPAEVYKRAATLVAIFVALPILFEFKPTSVYEYFEARFKSRFLRKCGAILYLLFMTTYMGVVLYAPAVALSGVTGVPASVFYVVVGLICNVYTSFGGLKAVVWTDTFQAGCMVVGLGTVFVKGLVENGGIAKTLKINQEYGRFDAMSNVHTNPFQYMTVWTAIFGGAGYWCSLITFNQISVQRYFSMSTMERAQKVVWVSFVGYTILPIFADLSGLIMFAYYLGCDPISSQQIAKADQLVTHFALDTVGEYPGLPGIFLACLFSGTLSTISSGINSMAAVAWEDFIADWVPEMDETKKRRWITFIALGFGFVAIAMAAFADPLGGILQMCMSIMGAIGGPICGLFILGMVFPQSNRRGGIVGLGVSVVITGWVAIGSVIYKPYAKYALELPVDECAQRNFTTANFTDYLVYNSKAHPDYGGLKRMYALSELFFPALGIILVVIVGWPISLIWKETPSTEEDWVAHEKWQYGLKPRLCITEFIKLPGRKTKNYPPAGHQHPFRRDHHGYIEPSDSIPQIASMGVKEPLTNQEPSAQNGTLSSNIGEPPRQRILHGGGPAVVLGESSV